MCLGGPSIAESERAPLPIPLGLGFRAHPHPWEVGQEEAAALGSLLFFIPGDFPTSAALPGAGGFGMGGMGWGKGITLPFGSQP